MSNSNIPDFLTLAAFTHVLTHKQGSIMFVDMDGVIHSHTVIQDTDPDLFNQLRLLLLASNEPDMKSVYDVVFNIKKAETTPAAKLKIALEALDENIEGVMYPICEVNDGGEVTYTPSPNAVYILPQIMQDKFYEMTESDKALRALQNFVVRLYKNPSMNSVTQAFDFIAQNSFPLNEDGRFYALKNVKRNIEGDLHDIYTGKIRNNVGDEVSEPRNKISDNPNATCSFGLHCCGHTYLNSYSTSATHNQTIVVVVDPADIVSVPADHRNAKLRICAYTVVREIEKDEIGTFIKAAIATSGGIYEFVFIKDTASSEDSDTYMAGYKDGTAGEQDEDRMTDSAYTAGYKFGKEQARYNIVHFDNGDTEEPIDPSTFGEDNTTSRFDQHRYDSEGYDDDGYDEDGYDRDGDHMDDEDDRPLEDEIIDNDFADLREPEVPFTATAKGMDVDEFIGKVQEHFPTQPVIEEDNKPTGMLAALRNRLKRNK